MDQRSMAGQWEQHSWMSGLKIFGYQQRRVLYQTMTKNKTSEKRSWNKFKQKVQYSKRITIIRKDISFSVNLPVVFQTSEKEKKKKTTCLDDDGLCLTGHLLKEALWRHLAGLISSETAGRVQLRLLVKVKRCDVDEIED